VKVSLNGRKIGRIGTICLGAGENSLALEEKSGQPADREPCPNAPNFDQTPRNQPPCWRSFEVNMGTNTCKPRGVTSSARPTVRLSHPC
jgi:hypothetical protein